eukprot:scaffold93244_cov48-Phaeocystis_antarctica.AAC.3
MSARTPQPKATAHELRCPDPWLSRGLASLLAHHLMPQAACLSLPPAHCAVPCALSARSDPVAGANYEGLQARAAVRRRER